MLQSRPNPPCTLAMGFPLLITGSESDAFVPRCDSFLSAAALIPLPNSTKTRVQKVHPLMDEENPFSSSLPLSSNLEKAIGLLLCELPSYPVCIPQVFHVTRGPPHLFPRVSLFQEENRRKHCLPFLQFFYNRQSPLDPWRDQENLSGLSRFEVLTSPLQRASPIRSSRQLLNVSYPQLMTVLEPDHFHHPASLSL